MPKGYIAVEHGGHNYRPGSIYEPSDRIPIPSIQAAKDRMREQLDDRHALWDETATITLYHPSVIGPDGEVVDDPYPEWLIEVGPRGGVVQSHT